MHNLTPHQHADHLVMETSLSDADEPSTFLDWMQRLFAQDLGEGHLEHCVSADNADHLDIQWEVSPSTSSLPFTALLSLSNHIDEIKVKPPLIVNPISRISFMHLPLRAPPVLA